MSPTYGRMTCHGSTVLCVASRGNDCLLFTSNTAHFSCLTFASIILSVYVHRETMQCAVIAHRH